MKHSALTTINDVTSPLSVQESSDNDTCNGLPPPYKSAYLEQQGQRKSPPELLGQTGTANAADNDAQNGLPPDNDNHVDGRKYNDVDNNDEEEENVNYGNDGYDDDEEFNVDDDGDNDDGEDDDEEYIDVDDEDGDDYNKNDDDNLPPLPPEINVDGMSNYEIRRLRKIRRNEAKLKSLGLMNDGEGKHDSSKVPKTSMRVKPGDGLYYPDNDAFEADVFNEDYNDKYRSSIPAEAFCDRNRNRIMGGPQPPDNAMRAEYRH